MVSDDCRSAFYCSVFAQAEGMDGCLKECAEGQIIDINRWQNINTCIVMFELSVE